MIPYFQHAFWPALLSSWPASHSETADLALKVIQIRTSPLWWDLSPDCGLKVIFKGFAKPVQGRRKFIEQFAVVLRAFDSEFPDPYPLIYMLLGTAYVLNFNGKRTVNIPIVALKVSNSVMKSEKFRKKYKY